MTPAATGWQAAPVLDPAEIAEHLDKHGVFDAAEAFYDRAEHGEALGDVMTPEQVRTWLDQRCG